MLLEICQKKIKESNKELLKDIEEKEKKQKYYIGYLITKLIITKNIKEAVDFLLISMIY